MGGRLSRGWQLTKVSWATLRSDRSLGAFPVLAAIAGLLLAAAFGAPAALLYGDDMTVPAIILAAIGIYAITFAAVFFNVALAGAAAQVLDGEDATVASGMAVARANIRAVAGWAAMVATVNIIVRALQDRAGPLGDILLGGLLVAWNLVTFLAVPVIAFEGLGPIATLKRSASLFRERWGEQITGSIGIGLVFFLLSLPGILVAGIGLAIASSQAAAVGWVLVALGALAVGVVAVVGRAASATFGAVLYRYAATGETSQPFAEGDLRSVARTRTA
jgi:hypothetical protein